MNRKGVFQNQAMGQLPSGIFGNQSPLSGSDGGGIFTGPTALGINRIGDQNGLGEQSLPNWECQTNCMKTVATDHELETCRSKCDQQYPPETYLEPEVTDPYDPYDPGGQGYDPSQGQACNSSNIISMVQMAVGASIDGKWGPNSQAKLNASGQTFKSFAPGCTGAVPNYTGGGGGGGGGGGAIVVPPGETLPVPAGESTAGMLDGVVKYLSSNFIFMPVGVWAVGLIVLVAGGIAVVRARSEQ